MSNLIPLFQQLNNTIQLQARATQNLAQVGNPTWNTLGVARQDLQHDVVRLQRAETQQQVGLAQTPEYVNLLREQIGLQREQVQLARERRKAELVAEHGTTGGRIVYAAEASGLKQTVEALGQKLSGFLASIPYRIAGLAMQTPGFVSAAASPSPALSATLQGSRQLLIGELGNVLVPAVLTRAAQMQQMAQAVRGMDPDARAGLNRLAVNGMAGADGLRLAMMMGLRGPASLALGLGSMGLQHSLAHGGRGPEALIQALDKLADVAGKVVLAFDPVLTALGRLTSGLLDFLNRLPGGADAGGGGAALVGGVAGGYLGYRIGGPVGAAVGGGLGAAAGAAGGNPFSNPFTNLGGGAGTLVGGLIGSMGGPLGTIIGGAVGNALGTGLENLFRHGSWSGAAPPNPAQQQANALGITTAQLQTLQQGMAVGSGFQPRQVGLESLVGTVQNEAIRDPLLQMQFDQQMRTWQDMLQVLQQIRDHGGVTPFTPATPSGVAA